MGILSKKKDDKYQIVEAKAIQISQQQLKLQRCIGKETVYGYEVNDEKTLGIIVKKSDMYQVIEAKSIQHPDQ